MEIHLMKKMSLLGLLGGILYQIGDYLLFLHPDYRDGMTIQSCWVDMPMWRFSGSMWCALFGSVFLICGFFSLYQLVKKTCGKAWQHLTLCSLPGVIGVIYAHFIFGSLPPMIYKAMIAAGLGDEQFLAVNDTLMSANMAPIVLIIASFYLQLIVIIYGVVSRKFHLSKQSIFALILVILVLCLLLVVSFYIPSPFAGIVSGFESLFEGILYLVPYFHWKNRESISEAVPNG